jgi:DNA polymerase (family X)
VPLTNAEVARALHELAGLIELEEGSRQSFRARAYHNAVRALEGERRDVTTLSEDELTAISGIGKAIARKILEFAETGTIRKLDDLRGRYPPGYVELTRVPGIGPKTVAALHEHLGVRTIEDLQRALDEQRIRDVPGLGERTERKLARDIQRLGTVGKQRRTPIAEALPLAERIVALLADLPEVDRATYAGSLRRFRETVADLDILVASADPAPVMDAFVSMPVVREVGARGETKASVVVSPAIQVDLRVVAPEHWGAALVYFTGSQAHNVRLRERAVRRGWTLNEYGLYELERPDPEGPAVPGRLIAARTEEEIHAAFGMSWVPPAMREDVGELDAAASGGLPVLAEVTDLRGDLHVHTDLSGDGRQSLEEVVAEAARRGWAYLATTDHAEGLSFNGVSRDGMLAQRARIRSLQEQVPDLRILHGSELNIGPAGELDYDREFLLGFDWTVASVHSHFDLDAARQTERLVTAMRHPAVSAIGHLLGRRIGRRPGIEIEVEKVLAAAEETGTALEINSHLDRLDAPAEVLLAARDREVVFVVNSDAHRLREFDNLRYGLRLAERGWVPRERIANTWEQGRFLEWLSATRRSA